MTVIPVPGLGFELVRLWPDGEHDRIPVLAFAVDPDDPDLEYQPNVITPTGDTLISEDYVGAVAMPGGSVVYQGVTFFSIRSLLNHHKNTRKTHE